MELEKTIVIFIFHIDTANILIILDNGSTFFWDRGKLFFYKLQIDFPLVCYTFGFIIIS